MYLWFVPQGPRGRSGRGWLWPYHFFAWDDFLGLQMTWIMYESYHLIAEQRPPMLVCLGHSF